MSARADLQAKIAENDRTIERLDSAVAVEKAATATVVHALAVRLRRLSWLQNSVAAADSLGLPFVPTLNKHDSD